MESRNIVYTLRQGFTNYNKGTDNIMAAENVEPIRLRFHQRLMVMVCPHPQVPDQTKEHPASSWIRAEAKAGKGKCSDVILIMIKQLFIKLDFGSKTK